MRGDGLRVLVVGAGVAGTAAARTLRARGASVVIVERRPGPAPPGTGIYLPGNAVRALRALGLEDRVAAHAVRIRRQRTADHRGRVLFEVDADDLWDGVGPCLALARTDLLRVMLDGLGDLPVHYGRWPRALASDDRGVVVDLNGGRAERYDLVVGADGVHSSVRRLLLGGVDPVRSLGQYARRFLAPCPGPDVSDGGDATWSALLGPGSAFLTVPIGNGRVYCYCDGPADDPRPLPELLSGYGAPVPALLGALDDGGAVHAGPVEEVVLGTWSSGRVLLVGDAAHATSPNMAQGAAMALEDALVLADSLAAAPGFTEALAGFERRRRPRTDWVRAQTHRRDRARALRPALRDAVLRGFGGRMLRSHHRPLRDRP